jgi:hypothetical protein
MVDLCQNTQFKSCGKNANPPPCKISHFSEVPKYFFQLLSNLPEKSKRKREFKIEKSSQPIFSTPAEHCSVPAQIMRARPARYRTCASVAATRGPPVRVAFPNPHPSSGRHPPPARFRPTRDTGVQPRLPHAAPSHPLIAGRRLRTEPSPRVAAHRCATVACHITPLLCSPQCRGQALAAKGPVQRSLALCSLTTRVRCMPWCSLPL